MLFIICVFILGTFVDIAYFKIFETSGGAIIYLAIVIIQCTHILLKQLSLYSGNEKTQKHVSICKLLWGKLFNEINSGRESNDSQKPFK